MRRGCIKKRFIFLIYRMEDCQLHRNIKQAALICRGKNEDVWKRFIFAV